MTIHRCRSLCLALLLSLLVTARASAQALSTSSNALDRIHFGDTGTDAASESAHGFVNLGSPTGTGALGLTYREIGPSTTPANIGNPAYNAVLTFTMACSPTLQNYLTIQVWGSNTQFDVIYLYNATQGYEVSNYYATNQPEIDFQESDPMLPGRFVYETIPIPLSLTTGHTSVTLTLNAANSYGYYTSGTADLAAGQTSRPIYAAFTHTQPYLILDPADPQGTQPAAAAATPATYNSAYFTSILASLSKFVTTAQSDQLFGPAWTTAVNSGAVPPQIIGYFDTGKSPTSSYTTAQWLNNAAIDTSAGNNVAMERLDMLAYAYVTPNLIAATYQNAATEQAVVGALDAYSYMQALNGCWGVMTAWNGLGAVAATGSNPQGRTNAQCGPIEGAGTWAVGSAILQMKSDPAFLAALNQPIGTTLEPGVLRYKAYQTMLLNHLNFLIGPIGHGHAPNQDLLQAKAYVYTNLALRALDAIYGTNLAHSDAAMYSNYLNETAGLATEQYGGIWISNGGLGLELNGTGNGSYDGGYGWNDAYDLVWLAKVLNDNGIETNTYHPVRTVALNAVHAFSNFLYPSLAVSGTSYANTFREEETVTFRKNLNTGEINTGAFYYAAAEFNDPYALHGFYLEHANGIVKPMNEGGAWNSVPSVGVGGADDTAVQYLHEYADYVTLCNMVNTQSTDPSGVAFLNETTHADGVWADPTGSTIAIKHNGERLVMVLNWRPLQNPGQSNKPSASAEVVNNLARIHDTTATTDRIATVMMPASTATGASGAYKSGGYGTLYVGRYGNYLAGLNWQTSSATLTLAPDMTTGTVTDLITGANYDLTSTNSVTIPAGGAVALYQSLPTATLSTSALTFSATTVSSTSSQTITLQNSGTGPLMIGTASITGANATDFAYGSTCGATLAANASCTYTFTFTPQAAGSRGATFNLKACVSATAQTISLSGTGVTTAPPSLALTASPGSVSLAAGGSASSQLTLTPAGGFNGTVALACSSPQSFITCSLPSTALVGTSPSNVTLSINVASAIAQSRRPAESSSMLAQMAGLTGITGCVLLLRRRRYKLDLCVLLLSAATLLIGGCGGGSTTGGSSTTLPPAGTYTLTLTATGSGLSQPATTNVTVVVTH